MLNHLHKWDYCLLMSWSLSKSRFVVSQHGGLCVTLLTWGRKKRYLAQITHTCTFYSSTYHFVEVLASFATCALIKVSVPEEALRRFGFDWAHTALDVTGTSIKRWFTMQSTVTTCRSSCSNVQYSSVVECDGRLSPELETTEVMNVWR